ncbi:MAG TPA: hypothetical protein VFD03_09155 [Clostridia bacterium]|nr:hypothetical protein [Clostridia bacterium]
MSTLLTQNQSLITLIALKTGMQAITLKVSGETIDNLPALNQGKKTPLAMMLKGIRGI